MIFFFAGVALALAWVTLRDELRPGGVLDWRGRGIDEDETVAELLEFPLPDGWDRDDVGAHVRGDRVAVTPSLLDHGSLPPSFCPGCGNQTLGDDGVCRRERCDFGKPPLIYESVVKLVVSDSPERRARDIAEGIGYACSLLMDEYGLSADQIEDILSGVIDEAHDQDARRA